MTNPWLDEYIQNRQNCYFDWSFEKKFDAKCTDENLPISDNNFESDPWCIFVFNTMISFLKGTVNYASVSQYNDVVSRLIFVTKMVMKSVFLFKTQRILICTVNASVTDNLGVTICQNK